MGTGLLLTMVTRFVQFVRSHRLRSELSTAAVMQVVLCCWQLWPVAAQAHRGIQEWLTGSLVIFNDSIHPDRPSDRRTSNSRSGA
jgi:hypothetical protein